MLDEQCFVTWPNDQTFFLTSKFKILGSKDLAKQRDMLRAT